MAIKDFAINKKYAVDVYSNGFVIMNMESGVPFLYADSGCGCASDMKWMDVFDVIATETTAVTRILKDFLEEVEMRASDAFIFIDSMDYDGKGMELSSLFGYITCGSYVNISEMHAIVSPVMIYCDSDCNVTLCSIMNYFCNSKLDKRNVRLGSGKGIDEAIFNARNRINGIIDDVKEIESFMYERIYE